MNIPLQTKPFPKVQVNITQLVIFFKKLAAALPRITVPKDDPAAIHYTANKYPGRFDWNGILSLSQMEFRSSMPVYLLLSERWRLHFLPQLAITTGGDVCIEVVKFIPQTRCAIWPHGYQVHWTWKCWLHLFKKHPKTSKRLVVLSIQWTPLSLVSSWTKWAFFPSGLLSHWLKVRVLPRSQTPIPGGLLF